MKTLTLLALALSLLAPRHFLFKRIATPCDTLFRGYAGCISVTIDDNLLLHPDGTARPLSQLRYIYVQTPAGTLHLRFLTYTLEHWPTGDVQRWFAEVAGKYPIQPVILTHTSKGWDAVIALTPTHTLMLDHTADQYDLVEFR